MLRPKIHSSFRERVPCWVQTRTHLQALRDELTMEVQRGSPLVAIMHCIAQSVGVCVLSGSHVETLNHGIQHLAVSAVYIKSHTVASICLLQAALNSKQLQWTPLNCAPGQCVGAKQNRKERKRFNRVSAKPKCSECMLTSVIVIIGDSVYLFSYTQRAMPD